MKVQLWSHFGKGLLLCYQECRHCEFFHVNSSGDSITSRLALFWIVLFTSNLETNLKYYQFLYTYGPLQARLASNCEVSAVEDGEAVQGMCPDRGCLEDLLPSL